MNELAQLHCTPVSGDTPKLSEQNIALFLSKLPGWQVMLNSGDPRLEKAFRFKNFSQALDFTNRVAQAAEDEDHHPAILTEWGRVTVTWWTHRIRGLHQNDFIMAAKTEKLFSTEVKHDE